MALENAVAFLAVLTRHENSPALDCREKNSRHPGERREIRAEAGAPDAPLEPGVLPFTRERLKFLMIQTRVSGELSTQNQL